MIETRDPAKQAWREWNREDSYLEVDIAGVGAVESWVELTDVALPFVSFRGTVVFESDGTVLTSDSTLRFRHQQEVIDSLHATGFAVDDVRDAPDCPGKQFVFIASQREPLVPNEPTGVPRRADGCFTGQRGG